MTLRGEGFLKNQFFQMMQTQNRPAMGHAVEQMIEQSPKQSPASSSEYIFIILS